jgi:hypothetical protein
LGSVIAYDVLSFTWHAFKKERAFAGQSSQELLSTSEKLASRLHLDDQTRWAQASWRLWLNQRGGGNPWLVTDFVGQQFDEVLTFFFPWRVPGTDHDNSYS